MRMSIFPLMHLQYAAAVWAGMLGILSMLAVAIYCDLRTGRIPNWLTYSGIGLGLALAGLAPGRTLGGAFIGMGIGGGLFLIFWLYGALGAGDVKLMAALGALLGWPRIWDAIFYTALCGAVMGVLFLIWRRIPAVADEGVDIKAIPRRKQKMPYAVAIAAGTMLALILG